MMTFVSKIYPSLVKNNMLKTQVLFGLIFQALIFQAKAGEHDTLEHLKVGYSILDFKNVWFQEEVDVEFGSVPLDIEGKENK